MLRNKTAEIYYTTSPEENPTGPTSGDKRVIRGSAWGHDDNLARAVTRFAHLPGDRYDQLGFRSTLAGLVNGADQR